jgi:HK97 family phage portal protein
MSILTKILGGRPEAKADFGALTLAALLGGPTSKSGVAVNIDSALRVTTVLGCCRVLAEGIAQLPLKLYRENAKGGKELSRTHPLYTRLWRRPNDWQTSFEWRETMMYHATLTKGGFSFINRNSRTGEVMELLPLLPANVNPVQLENYDVAYQVADKKGVIATLPRASILHLRGPSWNSYSGMEMILQAREAIGLSIAAEESLARLYSNGSRPSGVLATDAKLQPDQLERIKRNAQEAYAGLQNAFRTMVLDGGFKYTQMSLGPVDSQTHESRKHQVEEIARAFRVFPQMIGYADKTSTYASAEQFFLGHVIHSLGPWIERWEQVLMRDLLTEDEVQQGYFAKFSVGGLLRGDAKSRAEYYASGIVNGWLVRNEARRLEDLDPIDGLDEPLVPLNMGTKADAAAQQDAAAVNQKALIKAIAAELGLPNDAEIEKKVGRILSARNEGKLKEARDLIQEVLDQVDTQDPAKD